MYMICVCVGCVYGIGLLKTHAPAGNKQHQTKKYMSAQRTFFYVTTQATHIVQKVKLQEHYTKVI